jgi:glycosyltransferase involved in cell wall biosynthesis
MGQPLVSVIIPAYNSGNRIIETIQSALSQNYPNIEILVIDDASTDDTWQRLQSFKDKIRLIRHTSNQGLSATRNHAIRDSSGEFIALLDHDDLWAPDKLSKQMCLFDQTPGLALVFSDCLCLMPNGKSWRYFQENPPTRERMVEKLLERDFIPCPTIVMRKSVLDHVGYFNEKLRYSEEFELALRIASTAPLDYCEEVLATYRIHDANFSKGKLFNNLERIQVLTMYSSNQPLLRGEIALRHLIASALFAKAKQWKQALNQVAEGFLIAIRHPLDCMRAYLQLKAAQRHRQELLN